MAKFQILRIAECKFKLLLIDVEVGWKLFGALFFIFAFFGTLIKETNIVHHMMERDEFESLANRKHHEVNCHQEVWVEQVDHEERIQQL